MFFGWEDVRKVILKSLICYSDWAGRWQQYISKLETLDLEKTSSFLTFLLSIWKPSKGVRVGSTGKGGWG